MLSDLPSNAFEWYGDEGEEESSYESASSDEESNHECPTIRRTVWEEEEEEEAMRLLSGCSFIRREFLRISNQTCGSQVLSRFSRVFQRWFSRFRTRQTVVASVTRRDMRREMKEARSRADRCIREIMQQNRRNIPREEGKHASFKIANSTMSHVFCCAACSSPLFAKQDVFRLPKHAIVNLEDSRETFIVSRCPVGSLNLSKTFRRDRTPNGTFRMRIVTCSVCNVFLGIKVKDFVENQVVGENNENTNFRSRMNRTGILVRPLPGLFCSSRRRRASSSFGNMDLEVLDELRDTYQSSELLYHHPRTRTQSDSSCIDGDQGTVSISTFFLGRNYVLVKQARDLRDAIERVPIKCIHCDRTITYTDQLLCAERRWSFNPEEPPSPACYCNSLVVENVTQVGRIYMERLAQGPFEMADLECKCGKRIGYKFVRDCSDTLRNIHQQGRCGIVLRAVKTISSVK